MRAANGLESSEDSRQAWEDSISPDSRNTSMLQDSNRAQTDKRQSISLFPPELLAAIFHLLASDEPPTSSSLGWIRATHVCSQWRGAACADGTLWSSVSDELGEEWTKTMLQRARSAPISFRTMFCRSCIYAFPFLKQHHRQIEKLDLSFSTEFADQILQLLATDLEQLKDIRLKRMGTEYDDESDSSDQTIFPITLSASKQALRRISFSGILVGFSQQLPRHLEHLEIIMPWPFSLISTLRLPTLLSASSGSLVSLRLDFCLSRSEYSLFTPGTLFLPHLQQLQLLEEQVGCSVLIASLRMPALRKLAIECDGYGDDSNISTFSSINHIFDLLQRTPAFLSLKKLKINIPDHSRPDCLIAEFSGWQALVTESVNPDISLTFDGYHTNAEEFQTMLHSSPFRSVNDLTLRSNDVLISDWLLRWQDFANSFPNVTCFRYDFFAMHETDWLLFFEAFSSKPPRSETISSSPLGSATSQLTYFLHSLHSSLPIFPKLHRLEIRVFAAYSEDLPSCYERLRQCLLSRRELGFGIKELYFIAGHDKFNLERVAESFRSVVTSVTFEKKR